MQDACIFDDGTNASRFSLRHRLFFVVVNHYGSFSVSAARVDIGVMGDRWKNIDDSLLYLHRTTGLTSTKCAATDLKVGDDIVIRYRVSKAPGSYPGKVEEGKSYMAYLSFDPKRGDQVYDSAAGRGTFMAVD